MAIDPQAGKSPAPSTLVDVPRLIASYYTAKPDVSVSGEHFPEEARAVQWTEVAPYTSTVPAFWTSPRAIEIEDVLKAFAAHVARMIRRAPKFDANWPVVEARGMLVPNIGLARL
jgi:hypothetical protein